MMSFLKAGSFSEIAPISCASAQSFLGTLDKDPVIGAMVDATSYYELEAEEYARKGVTLTPVSLEFFCFLCFPIYFLFLLLMSENAAPYV